MNYLTRIFNQISKEIGQAEPPSGETETFYFGDDTEGFEIDRDYSDMTRTERLEDMRETLTDATEFSGYDLGDEVIYDNAIHDSRL